jgi:hypothetical protein
VAKNCKSKIDKKQKRSCFIRIPHLDRCWLQYADRAALE